MTMSIMRLLLSFWPCLIVSRVVFGGHLRSISDKIDSSDSTYSYQRSSTKRVLEDGIDPLQEFIGKALLQLPKDVQATQDFGYFGQFEMNISEFRCFDLSFSDIILLSPAWEEEDYVQMEITDFTFKCDFDISWSYGFVNGEGSVYVSTGSNLLTAKRPIRQATMKPATDYYQNVPEETDNCWGTEIEIDELEFNGDMSLRLLNTVRGFIRRNAERELAETFCEILMETLGQGLRLTDQVLREYNTVPLSQEVTNPLYLEAAVAARAEGTGVFMDLQRCQRSKDIECYMIMVALSEVNKMYAAVQYDEDATTIDMKEYGVNSLLRNFVLDDDGAYTWIGSGDESTLSTKTPIVDINTTIHSLKVYGLDSAAVLTPVSIIGHSTISSDLHWDQLALSLNVTIEIAANTSKGTFVGNGDSMEPIKENIIVTAKADNVSATVSMMVPLDEKEVELIPLGYVLGMLPLPDCIPPVLSDIEVSGFNVTAESLQQPTFEGIVSQDIEKLLNSGGGVGKKFYENAILEVLPIIFQTHVRNGLNDNLSEYHCKATGRELKEAIPFRYRSYLCELYGCTR